jgi:hypothetical protein
MSTATLPVVDLDLFLAGPIDSPSVLNECKRAAEALIQFGAVILKDSRISEEDNSAFLDLQEVKTFP